MSYPWVKDSGTISGQPNNCLAVTAPSGLLMYSNNNNVLLDYNGVTINTSEPSPVSTTWTQICSGGGGGGGLTYETIGGTTPASVTADTTTITDGTHALPTVSATQGKMKTFINLQDLVYTPLLGSTGIGSGTPLTFFNPTTSQAGVQIWDIVDVSPVVANTIAVVGRFDTLPVVSGTPTNTNGKGIFLYNKLTGAMTTLGSGLTINSNAFSAPGGTKAFYISATNRLYVFGGFSSAGGVVNTVGCAYWDFSLVTPAWVSLGIGCLQGTNPYVFGGFRDGTDIYITGEFTTVNNVSGTFRVAKLNTTTNTWSALGNGMNGGNNGRGGFKLGTDFYFFGGFTSCTPPGPGYASNECAFFARWTGLSWFPVGKPPGSGVGFTTTVNGACANLTGTKIYAVGGFTTAPGASAVASSGVAEYDIATNTWSQPGTGFSTGGNSTAVCLSTGEIVAVGATGNASNGGGAATRSYNGLAYFTPGVSTDWVAKGGGLGSTYNIVEISPTELWLLQTSTTIYSGGRQYGSFLQAFKADLTKVVELTGSFLQGFSYSPITAGNYNLQTIQLAQNVMGRLVFNGTRWIWDGLGSVASF
jgi:hypothetical protein